MEIIENKLYVDIIKNNIKYHYNKPDFIGYDYLNLIKILCELNIDKVRIGIKTCNIVSEVKILNKLRINFGKKNVIFTGDYKNKIYQYNIRLLNDNEYNKFRKSITQ